MGPMRFKIDSAQQVLQHTAILSRALLSPIAGEVTFAVKSSVLGLYELV